ncbi:MAG: hypothetical protein R2795_17900 [Saprospiraceae bacterium]
MWPTYKKPILFSFVNAWLMLLLAMYWLGLPRTFGDEAVFIKWTSLVKKSLLGIDPKPTPGTILYLDVSDSKMLVDIQDPLYGEYTGYQHAVITDRFLLAQVLDSIAVHGKNIPIVLMDISFERPSPADSLLQASIDRFPFPIVAARRILNDGSITHSCIRLPTGIANYQGTNDEFLKYRLFYHDTLPTLPLLAYSLAYKVPIQQKWWGTTVNGQWSLSNPIIDFKIRPQDISNGVDHLERPTTYGLRVHCSSNGHFGTPGYPPIIIRKGYHCRRLHLRHPYHRLWQSSEPLIVHNTFLTLAAGEARIKWLWMALLFLFFLDFFPHGKGRGFIHEHQTMVESSKSAIGKIIYDSIDEVFFLALCTILSY